jgi:hypothetical protein
VRYLDAAARMFADESKDCGARYYPDYYVDRDEEAGNQRIYYPHDQLASLHFEIGDHYYMSVELAELFTHMMCLAWCVNLFCEVAALI